MKNLLLIIVILTAIVAFTAPSPSGEEDLITNGAWKKVSATFTPLTIYDTLEYDTGTWVPPCSEEIRIAYNLNNVYYTYSTKITCEEDTFLDSAYWFFYGSNTKLLLREMISFDTIDTFNIVKLTLDSLVLSHIVETEGHQFTGVYKFYND